MTDGAEGSGRDRRDRTVWAAWRVADDGRLEVSATLEAGDGYRREQWEYTSLEDAAEDLGDTFREVVERVLGEGRRKGRWRP